jgi:hypothetical protein
MANAQAISGTENVEELRAKIEGGDSYTLDARAVAHFVTRYAENQLSADELEHIGDLIEGAEFVEYVGPGSDGIIAQVIFGMSTPETQGPITKEAAERWLRLLEN